MNAEKELSQDEIKRLQALRARYWQVEKEYPIRANYVIEQQEKINLEVLDIVLGIRE